MDDLSIVKTMFLLMERSKIVTEPAGAASLAYLISNKKINSKKQEHSIDNIRWQCGYVSFRSSSCKGIDANRSTI